MNPDISARRGILRDPLPPTTRDSRHITSFAHVAQFTTFVHTDCCVARHRLFLVQFHTFIALRAPPAVDPRPPLPAITSFLSRVAGRMHHRAGSPVPPASGRLVRPRKAPHPRARRARRTRPRHLGGQKFHPAVLGDSRETREPFSSADVRTTRPEKHGRALGPAATSQPGKSSSASVRRSAPVSAWNPVTLPSIWRNGMLRATMKDTP